jgi:arylsulfatase A-like enzyme
LLISQLAWQMVPIDDKEKHHISSIKGLMGYRTPDIERIADWGVLFSNSFGAKIVRLNGRLS